MAFSRDDLQVAEDRVAALRERVAQGQARIIALTRRGEPVEAAEAEQHAMVEMLGRMIEHIAAVRLSVARRGQAEAGAPRHARRA